MSESLDAWKQKNPHKRFMGWISEKHRMIWVETQPYIPEEYYESLRLQKKKEMKANDV